MRCARSPTSRRPSRKPSRSPQPHDDSPPGQRVVINLKTPHELGIMRRAGLALCGPGSGLGAVSGAGRRHGEAAGFGVIRQFGGHGIGRNMHEDPQVPNFGRPGTGPELKPGMTLAIEPMVNAGSPDVYIKPDGWTVCTVDGQPSSYYEHTVAITKEGASILTTSGEGLSANQQVAV